MGVAIVSELGSGMLGFLPVPDRLGPPPSTVGFTFDNSGGLPRASASERSMPGIGTRSTLLALSQLFLQPIEPFSTHRFFGGA